MDGGGIKMLGHVAMIIFFFIMCILCFKLLSGRYDWLILPILAGGLVFAVLFLASVTITISYWINHENVGKEVVNQEISALSLGSETEGKFFLGSGRVEGEQYYYYFTPEQGGHRLHKVNAEKAIIIEDDNEQPRLVTIIIDQYGFKDTFIYIPEGSIYFDYNVKLP